MGGMYFVNRTGCQRPRFTVSPVSEGRSDFNLSLLRIRVLAEEDDGVADLRNQHTVGLLHDPGGEFLFLLLELGEFHLDEFVLHEKFIDGLEKGGADAVAADLDGGVEALTGAPEGALLFAGEFFGHARWNTA